MATPLITDVKDPIVQMVRDYSVILKSDQTFSGKDILAYLNNHAFPRIRGRLLTATDSARKHIFYDSLGDLAADQLQAHADQLVLKVMTDGVVKDYVFRIASALTAGWKLKALAGQVKEQALIADELEKQALADLEMLVVSPELSAAALAAQKVVQQGKDDGTPKIYLALDIDPATYDPVANSARAYVGAQEDGTATLWVGPYSVTAPVTRGDTPAMVQNALLNALRAYQRSNPPPSALMNLVIGPNEGPPVAGSRPFAHTQKNVAGQTQTTTVSPTVYTNIGWLEFHAYQQEQGVEALFCTLELKNSQGDPGITGLLYGHLELLDYAKLTQKGPYSVFLDLKDGASKSGHANPSTVKQGDHTNTSDTFFFTVGANPPDPGLDTPSGGRTAQNSVLRYQIANVTSNPALLPGAPQPRTIIVPAGSSALDVVQLIARDMEQVAFYQKVLPAVRSPIPIQVMGSPVRAPGLEIVPYRPSGFEDKIVFDMLEVPADVHFGVLPPNLVTNGAFDNQPKSLVVDVKFVAGQASKLSPLSSLAGRATIVQPTLSQQMQTAFNDVRFYNRGLF